MTNLKSFDDYWNENPRNGFPDGEIEEFRSYAKRAYREVGQDEGFAVNNNNVDEDEIDDEVDNYIMESAELLLLFREFIKQKEAVHDE